MAALIVTLSTVLPTLIAHAAQLNVAADRAGDIATSSAHTYRRLAASVGPFGIYTDDEQRALSRFDVLGVREALSSHLTFLRSRNRDIDIFYVVMPQIVPETDWHRTYNWMDRAREYAEANDWVLLHDNGEEAIAKGWDVQWRWGDFTRYCPRGTYYDPNEPELDSRGLTFAEWLSERLIPWFVAHRMHEFDGLWWEVVAQQPHIAWFHFKVPGPHGGRVDWNRNGLADWDEGGWAAWEAFAASWDSVSSVWIDAVRENIGYDVRIIAGGDAQTHDLTYYDGFKNEEFLERNRWASSDWRWSWWDELYVTNTERPRRGYVYQRDNAREGWNLSINEIWWQDNDRYSFSNPDSTAQYVRFALGTTLLGDGLFMLSVLFENISGLGPPERHTRPWVPYLDDFYDLNLGPYACAFQKEVHGPDTLYVRAFHDGERLTGLVKVNPSRRAVEDVPPRDALILSFKEGDDGATQYLGTAAGGDDFDPCHLPPRVDDPTDGWFDRFGSPTMGEAGMNGAVTALTTYDGDLIAAGEFVLPGVTPSARIARWDGVEWYSLGSGLSGDAVNALVVHDDELIVAGAFNRADGQPVSNIAAWDGTAWRSLGSGLEGPVNDVVQFRGRLVAAIDAEEPLHEWNGTEWQPIPLPTDGPTRVTTLGEYKAYLFTGGTYQGDNGRDRISVDRWDDATWRHIGSGTAAANTNASELNVMSMHGGRLIVGGRFVDIGGVSAANVARWNGTTWSALGDGVSQARRVETLTSYKGGLIVAGHLAEARDKSPSHITYWNGFIWQTFGGETNAPVYCLQPYDGDLYVGGLFTRTGRTISHYVAAYGGPVVISSHENGLPIGFDIVSVSANPFSTRAVVEYVVPVSGRVKLNVFDVTGRKIRTLLDGAQAGGRYAISWDGSTDAMHHASAGVYFVRLDAAGAARSWKVILSP